MPEKPIDTTNSVISKKHLKQESIKAITQSQNLSREVMAKMLKIIEPGISEAEIAQQARQKFNAKGVTKFWYYDVAALVLVGERTIQSISGRDYVPCNQTTVQSNDLVTIDLSPVVEAWGDYARSIYVEKGRASFEPSATNQILRAGFEAEQTLHQELLSIAKPNMTAHELWEKMNERLKALGFENLDFKDNLGHSIEKSSPDRRYLEAGNKALLSEMQPFTFEPHIRNPGGKAGFKHENIYFFVGNTLQAI